jgi:hypothetical protein
MTDTTIPARRFISEDPAKVIRRLPRIGNLMIIGKRNGATHERIGAVETVTQEAGLLLCRGSCHDSRIDPASIHGMIIDTSSIMQGQVYPRIDFNGGDGQPIFSIVGFGGLEPFEAALEGLAIATDESGWEKPERPKRDEVSLQDPGFAPLRAALASAQTVTIAFDGPGFSQSWTGVVPKVNPGMGFINIMDSDFHLHLLGGTVGAWKEHPVDAGFALAALDHAGQATGLSVRAARADTLTIDAADVQ